MVTRIVPEAALSTAGMTAARLPNADQRPAAPRVRAAASGDREAAACLVRELLPRVRNLVRYLIRGDIEVDDVAQEALVAILQGLDTYRADGSLRSWADRVTVRTTFAWLRRRQASQARELEVARQPRAPELAPDECASSRQLVRLLDALPFDQRHALVLHHVLQLSVTEVADEMKAPVETVRSRLRLGKQRLVRLAGPPARKEAG